MKFYIRLHSKSAKHGPNVALVVGSGVGPTGVIKIYVSNTKTIVWIIIESTPATSVTKPIIECALIYLFIPAKK